MNDCLLIRHCYQQGFIAKMWLLISKLLLLWFSFNFFADIKCFKLERCNFMDKYSDFQKAQRPGHGYVFRYDIQQRWESSGLNVQLNLFQYKCCHLCWCWGMHGTWHHPAYLGHQIMVTHSSNSPTFILRLFPREKS